MGNTDAKLRKIFEEIDTSGDKKLSASELAIFFSKPEVTETFVNLSPIEVKQLLSQIENLSSGDKDNDDKLSFDELMEALKSNPEVKNFIMKIGKEKN